MKDFVEQDLAKGDYIVFRLKSHRSHGLVVGEVDKVTPKGAKVKYSLKNFIKGRYNTEIYQVYSKDIVKIDKAVGKLMVLKGLHKVGY